MTQSLSGMHPLSINQWEKDIYAVYLSIITDPQVCPQSQRLNEADDDDDDDDGGDYYYYYYYYYCYCYYYYYYY